MTKILVIEDETILREEIVEWLTLEGYTVVDVANGQTGIEATFSHLPDLIVCDIMMPQVDGYGVLSEVRGNSETVDIPFIFLTAKAAHDEIRKGMDLGADDYITKPFTRLELLQAIQARLDKKHAQRQAHQNKIEQLQQALTQADKHHLLKAKLIAMFSHDFVNSLTSILITNGLLRTYADTLTPSRRMAHLNRIESSTRLLVQLLDDLLVIAQMETGRLNVVPEVINMVKFFQRIQEECQIIYGQRCQLLLESHGTPLLAVDTRLLRLIVANLCTYLIRHSSNQHTVHVMIDGHAEVYYLTMQNQTAFVAEADYQSIKDALAQSADLDNINLIGLELAIVRQAVILQGGSIQFDSNNDVSPTITITIPALHYEDVIDECLLRE